MSYVSTRDSSIILPSSCFYTTKKFYGDVAQDHGTFFDRFTGNTVLTLTFWLVEKKFRMHWDYPQTISVTTNSEEEAMSLVSYRLPLKYYDLSFDKDSHIEVERIARTHCVEDVCYHKAGTLITYSADYLYEEKKVVFSGLWHQVPDMHCLENKIPSNSKVHAWAIQHGDLIGRLERDEVCLWFPPDS